MSSLRHSDLDFRGSGQKRGRYTTEEYISLDLPPAEDLSWKVLGEIFSRPWFVRTWVIQEVVFSKVHPQMLCGSQELTWRKMLDSAAWPTSMCYNLTPLNLDAAISPALRSLNLFNELRNASLPCDLTTLLNKATRFKASDPRDKVYSLLGLTGGTEATSLPAPIEANYEKSVEDVFRDITRYIILSAKDLRILTLIRYIPDWDKYPSWVVDFTAEVQWERISYFAWSRDARGVHGVKEAHNNAAGGLPVDVRVPSLDNVLTLMGLRIDSVGDICEVMSKSELDSFRHHALFAWKGACQLLKTRYNTIDTLARAFMVTLAANWNLSELEMVAGLPLHHFWAYMWRVYCGLYEEAMSDEDRKDIENEYRSLLILPNTGNADLYRLYLDGAHNRRIFFTKDLSYLGLGPCIMQEGDIVCVLFGGATPMILRPERGQYRFVGECYVYDLMDGESIRDRDNGNCVPGVFQLV